MRNDREAVAARAREIGAQLQEVLADLGTVAQREGRSRLRRAIGAPPDELPWLLFGAGVVLGLAAGAAVGVLLSGRRPQEIASEWRDRLEAAREVPAEELEMAAAARGEI